ncbi:MAG: SfiI family type II restriction endonuclease [Caldilinea sp.]
MLIDPHQLNQNLERLEEIERASLRLVVQALYDYRDMAQKIFRAENDQVADIGEDVTREALDRLGMSRIDQRLFGKMDYKRACYLFHPDYAVKQALFVDSKAEDVRGRSTATLQISQISMTVRQMRSRVAVEEPGRLPLVVELHGSTYLTTTIFVKYNYRDVQGMRDLVDITVAALPNGMLQQRYNPTDLDTIWLAGRNAPSLKEEFRVRLSFARLQTKASWRVQRIPMPPGEVAWAG